MTAQTSKTITGALVLLSNPCTSKPCLPGMAFAITADDNAIYFLVKQGQFFMPGSGKIEDMPEPGERIIASGTVHESHDIAGNLFKTIEPVSLKSHHS